jgi:cation transport ATPase
MEAVLGGNSAVNRAPITGESVGEKFCGEVFAGTIMAMACWKLRSRIWRAIILWLGNLSG